MAAGAVQAGAAMGAPDSTAKKPLHSRRTRQSRFLAPICSSASARLLHLCGSTLARPPSADLPLLMTAVPEPLSHRASGLAAGPDAAAGSSYCSIQGWFSRLARGRRSAGLRFRSCTTQRSRQWTRNCKQAQALTARPPAAPGLERRLTARGLQGSAGPLAGCACTSRWCVEPRRAGCLHTSWAL